MKDFLRMMEESLSGEYPCKVVELHILQGHGVRADRCGNSIRDHNAQLVEAELKAGTRKVFDCSKFTVDGKNLTSYTADVEDMGDFVPESEAIKTEGGITYFDESAKRSAPYFDIIIDGITKLN